jgi:glycosyltransferase involved in cell wall biosynthesis
VRIVLDYRPALRQRTGVGEFVHELARALASDANRPGGDELAILTVSWKDRAPAALARELPGVHIIDRRIPVRPLTWTWNRLGWPPVEWLAGAADVIHGQTPLLIPASHAAQVITIHDLDFLHHPERVTAEMRRDFPRLVRRHAARADHVIVSSQYAAGEVAGRLDVPPERISVCSPGAPSWAAEIARYRATTPGESHVLFVGTLEPRKNISGLLDAFSRLRARRPDAGTLVLAGGVTPAARPWIDRARAPDLADHVQMRGYVPDGERRLLYRDARMVVLPSFEEGFGLPVLEAMACGVPVVVSNRGSLPEVAGAAATPIDPEDVDALANEMERLLDREAARLAVSRGLAQASRFTWEACARAARDAYRAAVSTHAQRRR